MFNALKYIKNLENVGFPREQAEAQVQLVIDSFQENVATKSDLAELRSDIKTEMAELRSDLKTDMANLKSELKTDMADLRSELKTEMSDLKSEIAEMKTDLVYRLGGIVVLCTGILGFLIKS
jgi:capsule polysaccharide export protein KpsE/RkpR